MTTGFQDKMSDICSIDAMPCEGQGTDAQCRACRADYRKHRKETAQTKDAEIASLKCELAAAKAIAEAHNDLATRAADLLEGGAKVTRKLRERVAELKESIKRHKRDVEANHPNIKYWKEDHELWGTTPKEPG